MYSDTLELATVKLIHGGLEIRSRLKLDKASFAVTVATSLRIDNVEAGLTGEIF